MIQKINTEKAPKAVGPYVQANKVGNLIFCSGQLGINPETGKIVEGGVLEETKQIFKNIEAVLEEAGSSMNHIVKALVLLKDIKDFAEVNKIYAENFKDVLPARSAFQVAALPLNAEIEIEVIAIEK
ncbi:Rid family detoxifying hydrolase [Gemelliphila palaticanis]|uniref:RidA family protein n=1 Tax=Gemelliphila palaticanis TaxID=81950 RepID=A0ABX2T335_9BACL|nr:Rid family detoxifying hydrolase [Gemella palaticanis]MBF0715705.1 RidA family protein [Gemella palaticanis]NYS47635.1 RidA family protein [Gemella palaticanis]